MPLTNIHGNNDRSTVFFSNHKWWNLVKYDFLVDFTKRFDTKNQEKLVFIHLYLRHCMAKDLYTYKDLLLYIFSEKC